MYTFKLRGDNLRKRVKDSMKTAVIYNSQTGFTKRYAKWISDEIGADCFEFAAAKKKSFDDYDAIVFGGWACAGGVSKLKWFKERIEKWADKKLVAFCVGGSPIDSPLIEPAMKRVLTDEERKKIDFFYCPGGMNYSKMSASSRAMMKMYAKILKAKKNKSEDDEAMIKMISSSYDLSDRRYIEPIIECLQ